MQNRIALFTNLSSKFRRLALYLPLAALMLLIVWPSLRAGPPNVMDGPNHFYRLAALDWHVRNGDFYPRWFADLHYGFGAPVLNFYAPLSYYLPLLIHFLGLPLPTAFQLSFLLSIIAITLGAYYWGRDQFNSPPAGIVSAAAFGMSPPVYMNLLDRGGYPELWALAITPWLFWATFRWVRRPFRGARLVVTLLLAALLLTHNISALMFTPLLGLYCMGLVLDQRSDRLKVLLQFGLTIAHAAALAAFFLLPFFLESADIQLQRATLSQVFQYRNNFLEWRTLFSPPVHFDPYHVLHIYPISLPWPPVVFALVAIAVTLWRWKRHPQPRLILLITATVAATILLMNWVSLPVWDAIPPLTLIQFPARLMPPATFLLAWLAAAGLPAGRWQWPAAIIFTVSMFFFTLTWTYHDARPPFPPDPKPADFIRYEIEGGTTALGTTFNQEFLPRWVLELPPADSLLPRYAAGSFPSRLAAIPPGVDITAERNGLNTVSLTYEAAQATTLTFDIFYFPSWRATLDGQATPIQASTPYGLMTVDLPPGEHSLELGRQLTPPQLLGTFISALALLVLIEPVWKMLKARPSASLTLRVNSLGVPNRADAMPAAAPLQPQAANSLALPPALALLFVGLLALRAAVLDRVETPFAYTELDAIPYPLSANFSDQLLLLGYDYPQGNTLVSGETFNLKLYWRAIQPLNVNYQTTVQLVDRQGNRFGQSDNQNPAQLPTSSWKTDRYAIDEHPLHSLAGAPPGEYRLRVGVYALTDAGAKSLEVLTDGAPAGVEYELGVVTVTRGAPQPAGPLRFVEANLAVQTIGVGERLPFTLTFISGDTPSADLAARLQLTNSNGEPIFSTRFAPAGPDYPADQWTPNELIRYPQAIDLPPDLPAGPAQATLIFVNADGAPLSAPFDLGPLTITTPERSFTIPAMSQRADHDFGDLIRLLGYDLTPETITLYWQALQPVTARYTVFIHRFDNSGEFVGGNDAPPPRPTTSWLPGEVITDMHPYLESERVEVGLYDPVTGKRLGEAFVIKP